MGCDILNIKLKHPDAKIPTRNNLTDAGLDLYAVEEYKIYPHHQGFGPVMVDTGVSFEIPEGYVGLIWDRSGMGSKGFKVFGGVIDSAFRGNVKVLLAKVVTGNEGRHDHDPYIVKKGDKIAQILIQKIETPVIVVVDELSATNRGEKGFGSSGT